MGRYDNEDYVAGNSRQQRDLVLSINEFCFLQNKTNGSIKSHVGPLTMTISQQEALVTFNSRTKKFEETNDFERAKQLFISAPEGWYVVLKNPTTDNKYPEPGQANTSPSTIKIGTKINVSGPKSFALYPGQMAKVVRGHKLRSNQYLLARVYDAEAAKNSINSATIVDAQGKDMENQTTEYFVGQLLVIKGTEVSFYMPPTGIEVIPVDGEGDKYVRDAITLERLEYAILKDEDGEKRYVHGPAVVFPKPTETFVESPKGGSIFRALELSPISGIYVKVIAPYTEIIKTEEGAKEVVHNIGDELFITGKEQMIYYPRPEHAMIQYDGKYMHHAIAIPNGEGRYILNRLTGEIKTIKGPQMYLPDPRTEVVVKRKLTTKECRLFYPGNSEVLAYNEGLNEKATEKMARKGMTNASDSITGAYSTSNQEATLAIFEANANISRGVSYTKPRTITLDTKYEGVVAIDVWDGYAINVISKSGKREVISGPITRLLDYDETLNSFEGEYGEEAFLKIKNNKITTAITALTKDYVTVQINISYWVNFLEKHKDKWFSIGNYRKFLCDHMNNTIKRSVKTFTVEEFYKDSLNIIRNAVFSNKEESEFNPTFENGMTIYDIEVERVLFESRIANMLEEHQKNEISQTLELSNAEKKMANTLKLAEYKKREDDLNHQIKMHVLELNNTYELNRMENEAKKQEKSRVEKAAAANAEHDLQEIHNLIAKAKLERDKAADSARIETEKALAEIEKDKQKAYAETVAEIMKSVTPDLVAALNTKANADMLETVSKAVSPYSIANGESVSETVNRLLRGTSLEDTLKNISQYKIQ